jgi:hypothetical protein
MRRGKTLNPWRLWTSERRYFGLKLTQIASDYGKKEDTPAGPLS